MSEFTNQRPERPPDFVYKVVNPTLKFLLHTPLHGLISKRLLVLTFHGRKSGKLYHVVVGYQGECDALMITTQARWVKNLVGGVPVNVRLRGQKRTGIAQVLDTVEAMTDAYAVLLNASPEVGRFIGVSLGDDGKPVAAEVVDARQRGYVVISIALAAT